MRGLDAKVAIVTGGAQGIGKAVAERLAAEGASVLIADVADDYAVAAVAELRRLGAAADSIHTDVADEDQVALMAKYCADRFGGIDFLVNCAAVFIMRGLEATVEEWRRIMDVNIMGQALCVKHVADRMAERPSGAIVNIASISGHIAQPGYLTDRKSVV